MESARSIGSRRKTAGVYPSSWTSRCSCSKLPTPAGANDWSSRQPRKSFRFVPHQPSTERSPRSIACTRRANWRHAELEAFATVQSTTLCSGKYAWAVHAHPHRSDVLLVASPSASNRHPAGVSHLAAHQASVSHALSPCASARRSSRTTYLPGHGDDAAKAPTAPSSIMRAPPKQMPNAGSTCVTVRVTQPCALWLPHCPTRTHWRLTFTTYFRAAT